MNAQVLEIVRRVESLDFKFAVGMASGLRQFKRLVMEHGVFIQLHRLLNTVQGVEEDLVGLIYELSSLDTDVRYEHEKDTALATYLLALVSVGSRHAEPAAHLLTTTPRLWWAGMISRQVLAVAKSKSPYPKPEEHFVFGSRTRMYPETMTSSVRDVDMLRVVPKISGSTLIMLSAAEMGSFGATWSDPTATKTDGVDFHSKLVGELFRPAEKKMAEQVL